ncbi:hypothetical protein [Paenibacillus sabuli]|nr:hypothetical protein [Paenibacillus sabuli]
MNEWIGLAFTLLPQALVCAIVHEAIRFRMQRQRERIEEDEREQP